MTLKKDEAPDWRAAGLDYVGGDRPHLDLWKMEGSYGVEIPPYAKKVLDALNTGKPVFHPVDPIDVPPDVIAALDKIKEIHTGKPIDEVLTPPGKAKEIAAAHEAEAKKVYKLMPVGELEQIQKALEAAQEALKETPELPKVAGDSILQTAARAKFAELRSDLFDVRKDLQDLRAQYRHNLVRVFGAGVLIAWLAWTIVGGPS